VLLFYYYCPVTNGRNIILLFFSLLFYAWGEPKYVFLMIASILFNYRAGLFIGNTEKGPLFRKISLGIAVTGNLSLLFLFKYLGFASDITNRVLRVLAFQHLPVKDIVLPIGISFYTFQSISYLIDVYRNPALLQKNLLNLGLYITFFPQLIAGPIVRYHDIARQINVRTHDISQFSAGIERFIIGLSKKVLLANVFAETADSILDLSPGTVSQFYSWLGILAYTFQIYYDFSGYSDMAIGLGKMFGFHFLENFNYPYMSKSITEFWRRWHISLSSWFKDYLYIPLGGNRKGKLRTYLNLYIVFFITGLWHGAAVNFILWGLGHGTLLFIERRFGKKADSFFKNKKIKSVLSHIYVLLSVVLLWVFFRLRTRKGVHFIMNLFDFGNRIYNPSLGLFIGPHNYLVFVFGLVFSFPWWRGVIPLIPNKAYPVMVFCKYLSLLFILILSVSSLANNSYNPFIYFRF
jgi:alginate O-acetyltransferase complex protein AlgI